MKKYTVPLLLVAAMVIHACGSRTESHTVEEKVLREAVYASGEILPFDYEYITSTAPDRIQRILVREGDTVGPGQVLAVLGTTSEDAQRDILAAQVALARENASGHSAALAELEERIALAGRQYRQDSLDAQRYAELAVTQAVSRKQAEEMTIRAASSLTAYNNLRQQQRSLSNELRNQVLTAENQLTQYRRGRESQVLTSRIGGRVFSVDREVGETVNAREPIMLVGTPGRFKLELLVDERDISKVKAGQQVLFETDAYAGRQFHGRVNKITPVLQRDNRSFEIDVEVLDNNTFFPQSSVEANIVVRDSVKVMAIPADYLLAGDSVWLEPENGSERKVPVESGIRDGQIVEIRGGLQKGDIVIKKQP